MNGVSRVYTPRETVESHLVYKVEAASESAGRTTVQVSSDSESTPAAAAAAAAAVTAVKLLEFGGGKRRVAEAEARMENRYTARAIAFCVTYPRVLRERFHYRHT